MNYAENKYIYVTLYLATLAILIIIFNGFKEVTLDKTENSVFYAGSKTEKNHPAIVAHVVAQIIQNSKNYSNNVWTTLATLMVAIGLVLGSNKSSEIVRSNPNNVVYIQLFIFLIYVLHAISYSAYYRESYEMMETLKTVVSDISYYQNYGINKWQVIINLSSDTLLFLLLSFLINNLRTMQK